MDAAGRRPELPALSHLDLDKIKREEESYQHRYIGASQALPSVVAPSPTHQYPSHPPPPYSQPPSNTQSHESLWSSTKSTVHALTESIQSTGEDNEVNRPQIRQSLPSLSEALGVDSQPSLLHSKTNLPPVPGFSIGQSQHVEPRSPYTSQRYPASSLPPNVHVGNGNSYSYSNTAYSSRRPDSPVSRSYSTEGNLQSVRDPTRDTRPPLHLQTSQSTARQYQHGGHYPPSQASSSPRHEQQASHTPNSMGPPSFPYGYTNNQPKYAERTPPSAHQSGPIYQPSVHYGAPSTASPSWKSANSRSETGQEERYSNAVPYGESVKRHLDFHDLEAALSEIAQTSHMAMDFSRRYSERMFRASRTDLSISSMPKLSELEEMVSKSRLQMDSFLKIRDVVLAQHAALEQQAADERQMHKLHSESSMSASAPPIDHDQEEDVKLGFAGADTKKRRGRAAPPGRCHSCHRAETPEWRRGPDGARTLCNACGLHYAKLTRKQSSANKGATVSTSNLRPKE